MISSMLSCSELELEKHINDKVFLKNLTGAFSLYKNDKAVRDHLGIAPLYYIEKEDKIFFAYSRRELFKFSSRVKDFPPGHYYDNGFHKYYEYTPNKINYNSNEFIENLSETIRKIMYKDPVVLLSGGIDSAAVLDVAYKINNKTTALTVGIKDSEDIKSSIECCSKIGANHTIIYITLEEILEIIPKIIENIESWNYSLVRNSIPTYIAMKNAKLRGYDLVLTGDCADGVLVGQQHLSKYPGEEEKIFLQEYNDMYRTEIRRMQNQANSLDIVAWSPFIWYPFTEYIMSIPFEQKYKIKKNNIDNKIPLRDAFKDILPQAGREKMPISSGAGMDILTEYFNNLISDAEFEELKDKYSPIKFITKEHVYYFKIWKDIFFKNENDYKDYWKYGSYGSWGFYYD